MIAASSVTAVAQDAGSFLSGMDSTLTFQDSLSVFQLIDSLMQLEGLKVSQLAIRVGYNSNVLSTGRTLGIENFGLTPALSYYHWSGLYADVSGFWSKDFEPAYYLTIASVGYMHDFTKKFSVMAGYDRYFYSTDDEDSYIPYKNTLSITPMVELKSLLFSANYSFYFGDSYVHRIMPGITWLLEKRKWKKIDRIALSPSFYMLFGNEIISEISYPYGPIETIIRIRRGLPWFYETQTNVFGIMNYTFSAPLTVTLKNWSINLTYNYSLPKALPGETLTYEDSSYLSGSLTYFIGLK